MGKRVVGRAKRARVSSCHTRGCCATALLGPGVTMSTLLERGHGEFRSRQVAEGVEGGVCLSTVIVTASSEVQCLDQDVKLQTLLERSCIQYLRRGRLCSARTAALLCSTTTGGDGWQWRDSIHCASASHVPRVRCYDDET